MSASISQTVSSELNVDSSTCLTKIESRYALYLFSNNKHRSNSGSEFGDGKSSSTSSTSENDEPSVCLSLLEGNLNASQETVVRCYLLNALSSREDLRFENGGKYTVLHSSEDSEDTFGCYCHRLSKICSKDQTESPSLKQHTFFICLIGPQNNKIMESFCSELNAFCSNIITILDPEDLKSREDVKMKLNSWYFSCIEYLGRIIDKFKEQVPLILDCSLWSNVEVVSDDKDIKWDLERFIEACSSMASSSLKVPLESPDMPEEMCSVLKLKEINEKLEIEGCLVVTPTSSYSLKWFDKLKNSSRTNHKELHNILEGFKLKTVQDLNALKRLLQKAVNCYYALFNAYQFLKASGYDKILIHHVKREAYIANDTDILDVIKCLQDFMQEEQSKEMYTK